MVVQISGRARRSFRSCRSFRPPLALGAVRAFRSSGLGECNILLHLAKLLTPAPLHQVGGRRVDRLASRAARRLDSGAFGAIIPRESPSIARASHTWRRQVRYPCLSRRRACACTRALGRHAPGRSVLGRQVSILRVFGRFGGISPSSQRTRFAYLASAEAISLFAVSLSTRLHQCARSSCIWSFRYRAGHGGHFGRVGRFGLPSPSAPCARFAPLASASAISFFTSPSCSLPRHCTRSAAAASIG